MLKGPLNNWSLGFSHRKRGTCSATLDVGTPTIDLEGSMMQLAHQGRDKQNPGNHILGSHRAPFCGDHLIQPECG